MCRLGDAACGRAAHAGSQALTHSLDDALGICDAQPGQELAAEERAMIEVADDGEIALGAMGKAQVVAAGADVLAADDEASGLRVADRSGSRKAADRDPRRRRYNRDVGKSAMSSSRLLKTIWDRRDTSTRSWPALPF